MAVKLSAKLIEDLEKRDASDLLDVILELRPHPKSGPELEMHSRSEKIAALKEAFNRDVAPVEEVVRKVGGKVTGRAWINQTVRARVPAQAVKELAAHEKIASVDLPHIITPESLK